LCSDIRCLYCPPDCDCSDKSDGSDSDEEAPPPPPPKKTEFVPAAQATPATVLSFAPKEVVHEVPVVASVDFKRVYDTQYKRHYYVSVETGKSQWETPKEGIVECEDANKKRFYTDCQSGASGWTLASLNV
jgi:hypothetical protein